LTRIETIESGLTFVVKNINQHNPPLTPNNYVHTVFTDGIITKYRFKNRDNHNVNPNELAVRQNGVLR